MSRKKSRYKQQEALYGAGMLVLVLFGVSFSYVYFQVPAVKGKSGENETRYETADETAEDTKETGKEIEQPVLQQTQKSHPLTRTEDAAEAKPAFAPKAVILPPQSAPEKQALYAHRQKTKERRSRIVTKEEKGLPLYKTGKIVIIIDDLGNNIKVANELLNMNKDITFSVLPKLKHSKEIAEAVSSKNKEVLLHLPMEPENHKNKPGPGAITDDMSAEEIQKQVKEDMESVPNIVGINNHMGSKATSSEKVMESVLSAVKDEGLFYVDSVTSPKSKGHDTAQKMNLPTAKRDVFLDGVQNKNYVKSQIKKLKNLAKKNGVAVGIGHPHKETVDALKEMLPELEKEGIQIVPASEVVK